jgi:carbonic anhydrase/acetyltransferase-like protein (isoleucine patch superfamily)
LILHRALRRATSTFSDGLIAVAGGGLSAETAFRAAVDCGIFATRSELTDNVAWNGGGHMALYKLGDIYPTITMSAYVAPSAAVIGKVVLADHSSVWFGATLRGDNETISIGANSNVQDGAVMHTDPGFPLMVGTDVSIGHQAMLHGCTVGDGSLIGIQAVVLNAAIIGKGCLVGAGAVITERKVFADGTLILGAPAKVVRELTAAERENLLKIAANYASRGAYYRNHLQRLAEP